MDALKDKIKQESEQKTDEEIAVDHIEEGKAFSLKSQFQLAIVEFEKAIELNDTPVAWKCLAVTRFEQWFCATRDQRNWSCLRMFLHDKEDKYSASRLDEYLRDTYNTFVVTMDFMENKKTPDLLLLLATLYFEFGSYDGALSVCTLLVESYANFGKLNEALFLAAISTKVLNMHAQSAAYFDYVAEKPPYQLKSYFLPLLAGREYEFCAGSREKARLAFASAYELMITRNADCPSEREAKRLEKEGKTSVNERIQLWYQDKNTWLDVAESMMQVNLPSLVIDCYEQAMKRNGENTASMFLNFGLSCLRLRDKERAQRMFQACLHVGYFDMVARYYLGQWVIEWRQQFEYEDTQAILIQKVARGNIGRELARKRRQEILDALRRVSAIVIQCFIRVCQAKQRLEELRELQRQRERNENATMSKQDILLINQWLNHNATVIQGLRLIYDAKKERQLLRQQYIRRQELVRIAIGNSLERLKSIYFLRLHEYRVEQKEYRNSLVIKIQKLYRRHLFRLALVRLIRVRKKQEQMIHLCMGTQLKKMVNESFSSWGKWTKKMIKLKHESAVKIQLCFKGYVARCQYKTALEKQKKMNAFMKRMIMDRALHSAYLCFKALCTNVLRMRQYKKECAIVIQKYVRGRLARDRYRKLRSRAKKCEKLIIAFCKKRRVRTLGICLDAFGDNVDSEKTYRNVQAVIIQTRIRGVLARMHVQRLQDYHILYQMRYNTLKYRLPNEVLRLCFFAIREYGSYCRREIIDSAIIIQKLYRGMRERKKFRKNWKKMMIKKRVAEMFTKTFARTATAFFNVLREMREETRGSQHGAVRKIQRMVRKRFARDRLNVILSDRRKMMSLGMKIVNRRKHQLLRLVLYSLKQNVAIKNHYKEQACIMIQRRYRVRLARRKAKKVMAKKAMQAKLLQSANTKPTEYCFRKWEAVSIEKCVCSIRSAAKSSFSSGLLKAMAARSSQIIQQPMTSSRSWEEDFRVPSMSFYMLLNRVRASGVCHIPNGVRFTDVELRQFILLSKSIVSDSTSKDASSTSSQIIDIIDKLEECPLQKIIFYNSGISKSQILKLCQCISLPGHNLTSIVLGNTFIGNSGATALATSLVTGSCTLEQLILDRCGIGNPGVCALAEALCTNKTIWKLELSGNCVSDSSCSHLSRALMENTTLKILGLADNNIGDMGILCYIAPALANTSGLSQLELIKLCGNSRLTSSTYNTLSESSGSFRRLSIGKKAYLRIDIDNSIGGPIGSLNF